MTANFVSVSQMKEIDRQVVRYGMPIELMMENAGREICKVVLDKLRQIKSQKVLAIAGNGNNGDEITQNHVYVS